MSDDTITEKEKEENIIKKVCREYNLTYKELANEIGYVETSVKNLAGKKNDDISIMVKKILELFIKTKEYEKEIEGFHLIGDWFNKFVFKK